MTSTRHDRWFGRAMHARRAAIAAVTALLLAACTGGTTTQETPPSTTVAPVDAPPAVPPDADASSTTDSPASPTTVETTASTASVADDATRGCAAGGENPVPWSDHPGSEAVRIIDDGAITVDAVVYPRPDYEGRPWSQWGQGLALGDGRFISAIGDHRGRDGNSYIYEYNPSTRTLSQIADALSLTPHVDGDWGYGKIHAQMVPDGCGNVLVTTYWGSRRDLTFTDTYRGDVLLRLDPAARTVANLGVLHEGHGVPSLASTDGLIYAEAIDPLGPPGTPLGRFIAVDLTTGQTVFTDDDPAHIGYRSIAVDTHGRAYYSVGGGHLKVYDPQTNTTAEFTATMPGDFLRAVTEPLDDGSLVAVSQDPAVLFRLDPAGTITELASASGYTTSLALSADGSEVFSVPDAHGGAWQVGAPLIAVDTATGAQRTVVEMNAAAEEHLGLRLGGTYSVATHGNTVYIGMNAGSPDSRGETFGEVVLLIVELP